MRCILILALAIASTQALAQQLGTPAEQAMGIRIMQEVQAGVNCSAELIGVKTELAKAQARIKELETKETK